MPPHNRVPVHGVKQAGLTKGVDISNLFLRAIEAQDKQKQNYIDVRLSRVNTKHFSEEQKLQIWRMQAEGVPFSKILAEQKVDQKTLLRLIKRTSWPSQSEMR